MTTEQDKTLRALFDRASLRQEEYRSIAGKIKGRRTSAARADIAKLFSCSPKEVELIFNAIKAREIGQPMKLVEITVSDVKPFDAIDNANPYPARRGGTIGSLVLFRHGDFQFNGNHIPLKNIDQVWEAVTA